MPRTILLADDSITIHKVVELTFQESDCRVSAFDNGDEALGQLDSVAPDLVIADIHMPGADGLEVTRQVKEVMPSTPVLLLVGTFEPFDESEVEASGADGFLMKPFDSQELRERVDALLGDQAAPPAEAAESEAPMSEPEPSPPAAAESELPAVPAEDSEAEAAEDSSDTEVGGSEGLSDADIDRIARRVVAAITPEIVREVAREIVPEIAEMVVKERIEQLEREVD